MSTSQEFQKQLMLAGINTLKVKPWTLLGARLFGTKRVVWKTLDDGSMSLFLLCTWRGKEYLLRRLEA